MSHCRPIRRTAALAAVSIALAAGTATPGQAVDRPEAAVAAAYAPPPHVEQWWYDAMGLAELQRRTDGGKGVRIAVLDGYVDTSVPDLQGADVNIKTGCLGEKMPRDMGQEADHGTAMVTALVGQGAGNAAGGRGVLGVAPRATVDFYAMNSVHDDGVPDCGSYGAGTMMEDAIANGADVITIQVTGGLLGAMHKYVDQAIAAGVVVVVSSGNKNSVSGQIMPPANIPGVVAIGAADQQLRPWVDNPASNLDLDGFDLDFVATGVETPLGGFIDGRWVSGAVRTGTSGAAAIAAGAFALAKAGAPEATGNQLIQAAVRTGSDGGSPTWTNGYGWGTVRADDMLERDPRGWPDENPLLMPPREAEKSLSPQDYQEPGSEESEVEADDAAAAAPARQEPAASTTDEAGGPPVAALAIGGGIGLAVLLGAVVLARRRSSTGT